MELHVRKSPAVQSVRQFNCNPLAIIYCEIPLLGNVSLIFTNQSLFTYNDLQLESLDITSGRPNHFESLIEILQWNVMVGTHSRSTHKLDGNSLSLPRK